VAFESYGYDESAQQLGLLAVLYHEYGKLDKAIGALEEAKQLCKQHDLEFEDEDILAEYSAEKDVMLKSGITLDLTGKDRLIEHSTQGPVVFTAPFQFLEPEGSAAKFYEFTSRVVAKVSVKTWQARNILVNATPGLTKGLTPTHTMPSSGPHQVLRAEAQLAEAFG
jgi:hypothetical protein